jgi:hypothetical protein
MILLESLVRGKDVHLLSETFGARLLPRRGKSIRENIVRGCRKARPTTKFNFRGGIRQDVYPALRHDQDVWRVK